MLTDRYDLVLSTASAAARDEYVQASDLALTFYPGAAEAYDRAIAADPGFALAHRGQGAGIDAARRRRGSTGSAGGGEGRVRRSVRTRSQPHRVCRPCIRGANRGGNRRLVPVSRGMA